MALLLQLLDLPAAPEDLARRSPEGRQARTFALLRHLILDAAQQRPLVLVVENLHWSDPTSAAWLASLVERLAGAAVLLLGTYRPGYQPAWGAHAAVTQVVVPPLRAQESRTVVQAVLGAVSLPRRGSGRWWRRRGEIRSFWRSWPGTPGNRARRTRRGRCRRRSTRCWRPAWTGCHRRRSASSRPPPLLARKCSFAAVAGHCRAVRGGAASWPHAPPGGRVPL